MKAVLLAAGLGTRLRPAIGDLPKILAPVAGTMMLLRQLRYLERYGFSEVAINVHHRAEMVEEVIESSDHWPVTPTVFREEKLLGTAGGLLPMRDYLGDEPFLVLYGDVIADFDLLALVAAHRDSGGIATVACCYRPLDVGILNVEDHVVVEVAEKPEMIVNAGVYMLEPMVFEYIEEGDDFFADTFPTLLDHGYDIRPYMIDGVLDIGTPEALERANRQLG